MRRDEIIVHSGMDVDNGIVTNAKSYRDSSSHKQAASSNTPDDYRMRLLYGDMKQIGTLTDNDSFRNACVLFHLSG